MSAAVFGLFFCSFFRMVWTSTPNSYPIFLDEINLSFRQIICVKVKQFGFLVANYNNVLLKTIWYKLLGEKTINELFPNGYVLLEKFNIKKYLIELQKAIFKFLNIKYEN
jgi:hypothetical protein